MALKPLAKTQRISKAVIPAMIATILTPSQARYLIIVMCLEAVRLVTMAQRQRVKMQPTFQLTPSVKIVIELQVGRRFLKLITEML